MDTDPEVNRTRHQMKVPGLRRAHRPESGQSAFHLIRVSAMPAVW